MATMKDLVAEVKKCVKQGNPMNKCVSDVAETYDLDKNDKIQLRKAME